jgi:hypothetical protein
MGRGLSPPGHSSTFRVLLACPVGIAHMFGYYINIKTLLFVRALNPQNRVTAASRGPQCRPKGDALYKIL